MITFKVDRFQIQLDRIRVVSISLKALAVQESQLTVFGKLLSQGLEMRARVAEPSQFHRHVHKPSTNFVAVRAVRIAS